MTFDSYYSIPESCANALGLGFEPTIAQPRPLSYADDSARLALILDCTEDALEKSVDAPLLLSVHGDSFEEFQTVLFDKTMKAVYSHPFAKKFLLQDNRIIDCVFARLGAPSPSTESDSSQGSTDDKSDSSSVDDNDPASYWPYSCEQAAVTAKSNFNPWADEDGGDYVFEYPIDSQHFVPRKTVWVPGRVETPPPIESGWWPPRADVFAPLEYEAPLSKGFTCSGSIAGLSPATCSPAPHPGSMLWRIRQMGAGTGTGIAQANSPGVD